MDFQHRILFSRHGKALFDIKKILQNENLPISLEEKLEQKENPVFNEKLTNLEHVWIKLKKALDMQPNHDWLISNIMPQFMENLLVQITQNMQSDSVLQRNESSQLFIIQDKRLNKEQELPLAEELTPKLASVDKISNPEVITASNSTMS